RLQEASNSIRDNQLKERIAYSRQFTIGAGNEEFSRTVERDIGQNIDDLRERLQQANAAVGENPVQRTEEALDRLRRLASGLESMQERTRAAQGEEQREQREQAGRGQGEGGGLERRDE